MRVLAESLEVVVLDADSLYRAHLIALAAVNAAVLLDGRLAVEDTDSLGGAYLHAARTANTAFFFYLESVVKHSLS